jgi:hypothetical protein
LITIRKCRSNTVRPSVMGDVLVAYIEGAAADTVAICRMDRVSWGKLPRSQRL